MARKHKSWNWICEHRTDSVSLPKCNCIRNGLAYPIFVYTRFLKHFLFKVEIMKGVQGNQNAPGFGPSAKPWKAYMIQGLSSKRGVAANAFKHTSRWLKEGH